ncbi:hypothetical protein FDH41_gp72 [Acinetobacter phage WCHABP12]|uniref:Uncharacterized protein n=2 Tax=Obolenskvirus TaxID=1915205 RepID=A0A1V0DZE9_9CAUD|nr:hypothetical protein FDH41_gp72 [Acinetobacter phage WCHABP12]YP_009604528.1 hypothetical protein FDH91_gp37 [Acinetobacter phage WCHABP1]ARB06813.1 hypothetical protein ABP12_00072 [Acinetobacter phage WCHABP12]ARQ94758.1 hypothetical protein ABP1_00037 [Acinetobacter phage WCHABP1]
MKPEQFIREQGLDKARELLNADSDFKTYCLIDKSFWGESEGACSFCVDLDGLKRLVESLDLVDYVHGIDEAKELLEDVIRSEDYCYNLLTNTPMLDEYAPSDDLVIRYNDLKKAIADHESIYGGGESHAN